MTDAPRVLDPQTLKARRGSGYPPPHEAPCTGRLQRALGEAFGLTQYGVNLVTLEPGAWSAQRHWHSHEDELVYVLSGTLVLIDEAGEHEMAPGTVAGFPAGLENGHHLVNRGDAPATYLEIGARVDGDACHYPDIDLHLEPTEDGHRFTRKDGTAC